MGSCDAFLDVTWGPLQVPSVFFICKGFYLLNPSFQFKKEMKQLEACRSSYDALLKKFNKQNNNDKRAKVINAFHYKRQGCSLVKLISSFFYARWTKHYKYANKIMRPNASERLHLQHRLVDCRHVQQYFSNAL